MISETVVDQFSLTVSKSTRAGHVDESTRHLWKLFRWLFLSQQGLWRFQIHTSPLEGVSVMISQAAPTPFSLTFFESIGGASSSECKCHLRKLFHWVFLNQQGLRALPNPRVTFGRCFGDDFAVSTDSIFVDFFWVNRGCELFWIHTSPLEVVLLIFLSQQGLRALPNQRVTFGRCFGDDFPAGSDSVFVNFFWVKRGCERWWIQASPVEAVSLTISDSSVA